MIIYGTLITSTISKKLAVFNSVFTSSDAHALSLLYAFHSEYIYYVGFFIQSPAFYICLSFTQAAESVTPAAKLFPSEILYGLQYNLQRLLPPQ